MDDVWLQVSAQVTQLTDIPSQIIPQLQELLDYLSVSDFPKTMQLASQIAFDCEQHKYYEFRAVFDEISTKLRHENSLAADEQRIQQIAQQFQELEDGVQQETDALIHRLYDFRKQLLEIQGTQQRSNIPLLQLQQLIQEVQAAEGQNLAEQDEQIALLNVNVNRQNLYICQLDQELAENQQDIDFLQQVMRDLDQLNQKQYDKIYQLKDLTIEQIPQFRQQAVERQPEPLVDVRRYRPGSFDPRRADASLCQMRLQIDELQYEYQKLKLLLPNNNDRTQSIQSDLETNLFPTGQ